MLLLGGERDNITELKDAFGHLSRQQQRNRIGGGGDVGNAMIYKDFLKQIIHKNITAQPLRICVQCARTERNINRSRGILNK